MVKRRPLHPIDKEILRALRPVRLPVTPSKIAKAIGVHPTTVQRRLVNLDSRKITKCKKRGNRTLCTLSPSFKKKFNI